MSYFAGTAVFMSLHKPKVTQILTTITSLATIFIQNKKH